MNFFSRLVVIEYTIMKYLYLLIAVVFINASSLFSQQKTPASNRGKPENKIMQYWFMMLTEGKSRGQNSVTVAKIQQSNMANIQSPL